MSTECVVAADPIAALACEQLRGEPWQRLQRLVRYHIAKLDTDLDNYFRKDLFKDIAKKSYLLKTLKMKGKPSREVLETLWGRKFDDIRDLHLSMAQFVEECDRRELKIADVAGDMLRFIDMCEGEGRVREFFSTLPANFDFEPSSADEDEEDEDEDEEEDESEEEASKRARSSSS